MCCCKGCGLSQIWKSKNKQGKGRGKEGLGYSSVSVLIAGDQVDM